MKSVSLQRSMRQCVARTTRSQINTQARVSGPRRSSVRTMALFGGGKTVPDSLYDVQVKTIDGKDVSMSQFKGKVRALFSCSSKPRWDGGASFERACHNNKR